jgi:hypothetical protein
MTGIFIRKYLIKPKNMIMKNLIVVYCLFIMILTGVSCSKEGPMGPEGPAGPSGTGLTGSLVGWVALYTEYGVLVTDKSDVTVTVDGAAVPTTAKTNSAGKFQFDNLSSGTYEIVFTKTGYATRRLSITFIGGSKPFYYTSVALSQQTTTVTSGLILSVSGTSINYQMTVSPAIPSGSLRYVRIFVGNSNAVSSSNYLTTLSFGSSSTTPSITSTPNKGLFPSGTTLYAVAYGEAYSSYSFPDAITGNGVFSTIGSTGSNIASIIVP